MRHAGSFASEARAPALGEGTSESSWQTIWHKFPVKLAPPTTNFPFGIKLSSFLSQTSKSPKTNCTPVLCHERQGFLWQFKCMVRKYRYMLTTGTECRLCWPPLVPAVCAPHCPAYLLLASPHTRAPRSEGEGQGAKNTCSHECE